MFQNMRVAQSHDFSDAHMRYVVRQSKKNMTNLGPIDRVELQGMIGTKNRAAKINFFQ
jgi:hypothetical protein